MENQKKSWYKSKTKLGGLLIGLAGVIATVGGWITGTIDSTSAMTSIIANAGVVLGVLGLRDLPIINRS